MTIEDGSSTDYDNLKLSNRYSFGWLGNKIEAQQHGWKDEILKKAVLFKISSMKSDHTVLLHMGSHNCQLCKEKPVRGNGSYLIQFKRLEFRCPSMIEHYIEAHDYNPGPQAIEAILNGVWLSNKEEEAINEQKMHEFMDARKFTS